MRSDYNINEYTLEQSCEFCKSSREDLSDLGKQQGICSEMAMNLTGKKIFAGLSSELQNLKSKEGIGYVWGLGWSSEPYHRI